MSRRKKNENRAGNNVKATNLAFNRLGVILIEIAQNDTTADQADGDQCQQPQKQKPSVTKLKKIKREEFQNGNTAGCFGETGGNGHRRE